MGRSAIADSIATPAVAIVALMTLFFQPRRACRRRLIVACLLGRDLHRVFRTAGRRMAHAAGHHREDQITFRFTVAAAYYEIATALVPLVAAVPQ